MIPSASLYPSPIPQESSNRTSFQDIFYIDENVRLFAFSIFCLSTSVFCLSSALTQIKERPSGKELAVTLLFTTLGIVCFCIALDIQELYFAASDSVLKLYTCAEKAAWVAHNTIMCPAIKSLWQGLKNHENAQITCNLRLGVRPGQITIVDNTWIIGNGTLAEMELGLIRQILILYRNQHKLSCSLNYCPWWSGPVADSAAFLKFQCQKYLSA